MKFLQTGDLHLGKFFYEYPLLEDQKHVLRQLFEELKAEQDAGAPYDALVIAGDVYDRSLPPAEAVQVFSDFLAEIHRAFAELYILIIPGNHDSAVRLSYAQKILEQQRIHIRTDLSRIDEPVIVKDAAFYLMPFLQPASLSVIAGASAESTAPESSGEKQETAFLMSQSALAEEAIKRINLAKNEDTVNVLVAHLFAAGSVESDSERIIWGTAEQVDGSLFDGFAYTALGHLHRYQKAAKHAFYSGSPLAYSFGEAGGIDGTCADKVFLRVELEKGAEPKVTALPVKPLHKVVSLKGTFDEFFSSNKYDEYKDCFLEIESTEASIIENPVVLLRKKFPYLLSFKQEKAFEQLSSAEMADRRATISNNELSINSQFELFIKEIYGADCAFDGEKALFDELFAKMKEENHEAE
ncbi:MAG: exonuclease subunit SbcD [Spirochaetaceae bacterium]|nr:exonuclease subunit SbcD [Spirochaetaceae bacterium]